MSLTIGVDVGGTKVAAGVVDELGTIVEKLRRATPSSSPARTEQVIAAAVTELRQAAAGRTDLLAECAGTALGFGEGGQDAAQYRQIAELCIAAGADQKLIERWIAVWRQRADIARAMPHAGRRMDE